MRKRDSRPSMRKLGGTLRAPTLTGGFILKALGGEAILYGGCPLAWMADASVIGGRAMRASSLSGYVKGLSWLCSSGKLLGLVALVRPAVCLHSHHVRFTLCTRTAPFAARRHDASPRRRLPAETACGPRLISTELLWGTVAPSLRIVELARLNQESAGAAAVPSTDGRLLAAWARGWRTATSQAAALSMRG